MGCEQSTCRCHSKSNRISDVPEVGIDLSDSASDPLSGEPPINVKLDAAALDVQERLGVQDSSCKSVKDDLSISIETRDISKESTAFDENHPRRDDSGDDVSEVCISESGDGYSGDVGSETESSCFDSTGIPRCPKPAYSEEPNEWRQKQKKMITEKTMTEASRCLQVVIEKPGDVSKLYDIHETLGGGSFGTVKKAVVKASGALRAVKAIRKAAMVGQSHNLETEIRIGKSVDHPHITKLYEIFENDESVSLVMELCVNGHLQDLVDKRKQCSQQQTAEIMRQILCGVYYMHNNLICHRDLKPKNVLVATNKPLTLKITDFGMSCFFEPGKMMTSRRGSPAFMAPEVIRKQYTHICDMWSCGVIMYFVMCGYLPFTGATSNELMKRIAGATHAFETVEWVDVDLKTMDFIGLMMKKNPRVRYTAEQALHHDWFGDNLVKVKPIELRFDLLDHLVSFRKLNRLKRSALIVVASMLRAEDALANHKLFLALDSNGDGSLSLSELQRSVRRFKTVVNQKSKFMEGDLGRFFVDSENVHAKKKPFTYTEFMAATLDRNRIITDAICKAAFTSFDKNDDGNISLSELSNGHLLGHLSLEELAQTLEELDLDGDGSLHLKEFTDMLKST